MLKEKIGDQNKIASISGATCSGSVTKHNGDTFNIEISFNYNLTEPRDIGFTVYISQYEIAGTSGGKTYSGSGSDTVTLTSDVLSDIPIGTFYLDVELWVFPVGSIVGDIIDTVKCPNAITIMPNTETAELSSVRIY